ncbi:hypothetical protein LshimejAT787_0503180 [Lyophyllum shimeji]|uniref:Uncharacterized protein n=1 Tax=Lyophyllum shimeji TaxID=47721 RepID=A0A9P3UMA0_LYOSH|nr:hypothetical protein LshimejAT787_0503180 [Lyophyllum shimeji]
MVYVLEAQGSGSFDDSLVVMDFDFGWGICYASSKYNMTRFQNLWNQFQFERAIGPSIGPALGSRLNSDAKFNSSSSTDSKNGRKHLRPVA